MPLNVGSELTLKQLTTTATAPPASHTSFYTKNDGSAAIMDSAGSEHNLLDTSHWAKRLVKAASTVNLTLSGAQTVDGISLVAGDRILVKDQTVPAQNGVYSVAAGSWVRTTGADTSIELASSVVAVDQGTVNVGTFYKTRFKSTDTIGTTNCVWYKITDSTEDATLYAAIGRQILAGTGLTGGGTLAADRTLTVSFGSTTGTVAQGDDTRFTNARTPTAHAATHASAGSDPVTLAESQITNLVTDLAGKVGTGDSRLTDARTPSNDSDIVHKAAAETIAGQKTFSAEILGPSSGNVLRVGDDAHLSDVNVAHAVGIVSQTDVNQGGVQFGSTVGNFRFTGAGTAGTATGSLNVTGALSQGGTAVVLGSDGRLADARTPTAHAASHASAGSDPVTLAESQVTNLTTDLSNRALTTRLVSAGSGLTGGGSLAADRTLAVSFGTTAGTVTDGADARLSNARTPTAHASTHNSGGSDVVQLAEAQVTNLVTDLGNRALTTRLVSTGTGLTGGGDLSADRTHSVSYGTTAGTAVQGGSAISALTASAKDWVVVATTANITLSGTQTIDGGGVVAGDRVLVKNQTTTSQNGVYTVAAGAWPRATDFDASAEVPGATVPVSYGTVNAGTIWMTYGWNPGSTLGTTAMSWKPYSLRQPWTPFLRGTTTDPVMGTGAVLTGYYELVGSVCTVSCHINTGTTSYSTGSGTYFINPLPYAPSAAVVIVGQFATGAANPNPWLALVAPGATNVTMKKWGTTAGGVSVNMPTTDGVQNQNFDFCTTYLI